MKRTWSLAFDAVTNTLFTRWSKHRAIIEQTSSKCIHSTRARRVL